MSNPALIGSLRDAILHGNGPPPALECFALADALEELGSTWHSEARAYRWMGWWGRKPAFRRFARVKKPVAWYRADRRNCLPQERDNWKRQPWAHLPRLVFLALDRSSPDLSLYDESRDAVLALGRALDTMEMFLRPPV